MARFRALGFLSSLAFILYLDRVCWGQALTFIEKDLGVTIDYLGYAQGAFLIAYGVFELPTGSWGDRYGSRGVLTRIVIWWSLFTALTGAVGWLADMSAAMFAFAASSRAMVCFVMLLVVRFLFGAGEAGAFPNTARVVTRWFPKEERSLARGVILFSAQAGGAISPIIAVFVIERVGWRWAFGVFGSLGIVWAAAFYWWFRDDPAAHRGVSPAERKHIQASAPIEPGGSAHPPIPWARILVNRNFWLLGTIQSCAAFCSYMYMTWWPTYLKKGRLVDEYTSGWYASMVLVGGATGSFLGGALGGPLERWFGDRARAQRAQGAAAMGLAAIFLIMGITLESPLATSFCAAATCVLAMSQQATWWAVTTDISGRHLGAMFGLMNGMGVPGGFVSSVFLGEFVVRMGEAGYEGREQWDPAFYIYALILAVGASLWFFLDPSKTVDGPED